MKDNRKGKIRGVGDFTCKIRKNKAEDMKTDRKLYSLALISTFLFLFLIVISSTASASISETRTVTQRSPENLAIYDNKLVWTNYENNGFIDIYMYDLSAKKESRITTKSYAFLSCIYGNRIVYLNNSNGEGRQYVYMYDLSTKKDTRISHSGEAQNLAIYNNRIVWSTNLVGNPSNIYMYDLSTNKETQITTSGVAYNPAIYGDRILWMSDINWGNGGVYAQGNIYMHNLSTGKQTKITTSGTVCLPTGSEPCADIYGDRIVWTDHRSGDLDIYMYDLSTKKETRITKNPSDSRNPVIYGNNIVWQDNRNGYWGIYAYDLVTHQQIHTSAMSDQIAPAIYGNKVVWIDYRNGNHDIYLGTINYLPVAAFSASPTSGKHPLNVQFTDKSKDAYYWYWDFGDKTTSKLSSPLHKYKTAGKYTVTLKVTNAAGSNTVKKTNYITVK